MMGVTLVFQKEFFRFSEGSRGFFMEKLCEHCLDGLFEAGFPGKDSGKGFFPQQPVLFPPVAFVPVSGKIFPLPGTQQDFRVGMNGWRRQWGRISRKKAVQVSGKSAV